MGNRKAIHEKIKSILFQLSSYNDSFSSSVPRLSQLDIDLLRKSTIELYEQVNLLQFNREISIEPQIPESELLREKKVSAPLEEKEKVEVKPIPEKKIEVIKPIVQAEIFAPKEEIKAEKKEELPVEKTEIKEEIIESKEEIINEVTESISEKLEIEAQEKVENEEIFAEPIIENEPVNVQEKIAIEIEETTEIKNPAAEINEVPLEEKVKETEPEPLEVITEKIEEIAEKNPVIIEQVNIQVNIENQQVVSGKFAKIFSGLSGNDLASKLTQTPIPDLKKAISIHKKFEFINKLFNGNHEAYTRHVHLLNTCQNSDEAETIFFDQLQKEYQWDLEDPLTLEFADLIRRRYL